MEISFKPLTALAMKNRNTFDFLHGYPLLFMLATLIISGTSCSKLGGDPGPNEVWIQNSKFVPTQITIEQGSTITWINQDNQNHTITSDYAKFDSCMLSKKQAFKVTFDTPGVFYYHCNFHKSKMHGEVFVK
jgi:plastocyanin